MQNPSVRYGLIGGGIMVLIYVLFYFLDYAWLVSFSLLIVVIAIVIVLMTKAAKAQRAINGGSLTFGQGFKTAFLTALIISLISTVANFTMHSADTGLGDKLHDATVEKTVKWMEYAEAPTAEISKQVDELDAHKQDYGLAGQLQGLVIVMLIYLIPSFIIARVVKRDELL